MNERSLCLKHGNTSMFCIVFSVVWAVYIVFWYIFVFLTVLCIQGSFSMILPSFSTSGLKDF